MPMKAKSKRQLADAADVCVSTLVSWLDPYMAELQAMGYRPNMRVLPPHIVSFICDKLSIDI